MRRILATLALFLALSLPVSAGVKLLGGVDHSDKTRWSTGLAVQISDVLWSITSLDFNMKEGEKKVEPMLAALFDAEDLPLPLLRELPIKIGPILGPEFEYTDEGTGTGEALAYLKGAIGGAVSYSFDTTGQSGIVGYYKAAVSFDADASTTPLSPSVGLRLFVDISALNLGL